MMECPGLLSKGDLVPYHCHCPVHSHNYKLSAGGGLCMALLWWNLIGVGVTDEVACHPMPRLLCLTPHQRLEILQRCPHLGIYRRKGETIKLLFLFLIFVAFVYLFYFFVFVLCAGSQIQFCRSFNGLPQAISGAHIVLWVDGHCQCQVMVRCYVYIREIVWVVYEPCSSTD